MLLNKTIIKNSAKLLSIFALLSLSLFSIIAYAATTSYISGEVSGNSSASRDAVDAQDDSWRASFPVGTNFYTQSFGACDTTDITATPDYPITFSNGDSVDVALVHEIIELDSNGMPVLDANGDPIVLSYDDLGKTRKLQSGTTLQDGAPQPTSLYGDCYWNQTSGEFDYRNTVQFTFDTDGETGFGAWFGDVETRTDGPDYGPEDVDGNSTPDGNPDGWPARLILYAMDGTELLNEIVDPMIADQSDCGSISGSGTTVNGVTYTSGVNVNLKKCGDKSTRWIGFNSDVPISMMRVVVGDDDDCYQDQSDCLGNREHMSFMGVTVTEAPLVSSLELTKSSSFNDENGDGYAQVGETISYFFFVQNTGETDLTGVTVEDDLDGVVVSGGPVDLAAGSDANTETFTATYTLTEDDIASGIVENKAVVKANNPDNEEVMDESDDPETVEENDSTIEALKLKPEIELIKSGSFDDNNSDGFAQVGETATFTFIINNIGDADLSNITLEDDLVGVAITGGPIEMLEAGESDPVTFTGSYTLTQADIDYGFVDNSATVSGVGELDEVVTDDSVFSTPLLDELPADVTITKSTDTAEAKFEEEVVFNISYSNIGANTAVNTVITEVLPVELDLVSVTNEDGSILTTTSLDGVVSISLGDIESGEQGVLIVTTRVNQDTSIEAVNNVSVLTDTNEIDMSNNESSASVEITKIPLTKLIQTGASNIVKTVNKPAAQAQQKILSNTGLDIAPMFMIAGGLLLAVVPVIKKRA